MTNYCLLWLRQIDLFSPADRFMWEMNRIPRYEQRLKAIFFIRKVRIPRVCAIGNGSASCLEGLLFEVGSVLADANTTNLACV